MSILTPDTPRSLLVLATHHKPYAAPASRWLFPCAVGSYRLPAEQLGFQDSDGAEQISARNPSFCELTALYWAWKNLRGVEHIGLYHYRRYLYLGPQLLTGTRVLLEPADQAMQLLANDACGERALEWLRYADAVVPTPFRLPGSIEQHYLQQHRADHWQQFLNVLADQNPAWQRHLPFFRYCNRFHFCNMFLMRWDRFAHYCERLFALMFELEQQLQVPEDRYQARFIGFLAERFTMFYLHAEGLRLHETPIVPLEPGA